MKQLEEITNIMKKMAEVQKAEDTVDRVKWEILLEKLNEINEKLDALNDEDYLDERIFELEYLLDTAGEEIDRLRRKNKKLKKRLKKYEDVI